MRSAALLLAFPLLACGSAIEPTPGDDAAAPDAAIEAAAKDAHVEATVDATSQDTGTTNDASDASASDASDAAPDVVVTTKDGGLQCTNIAVPAHITPTASSSTPPTMSGGTIVTGLYHLTAATWYGVTTAPGAFGMAWDVSSTDLADADDANGSLRTETTNYTTSGSDITFTTWKCPSVSPNNTTRQYNATSTTLSVLWTDNGATIVFDFTKQ